ncbi:MAG TPA: acetate kinase [Negativicutes bacterium]|nr:acetate kinase [Negativicutes bacterium]
MKILVINAGSSSVKYQLIDMNDESVLASGIVERIGVENTTLKHQAEGKEKLVMGLDIQDHSGAVKVVVDTLLSREYGGISSMDEIGAVGHRIAHGGNRFLGSVLIDESVMQAIRENIELAPLHNPANIFGIEACQKVMPDKPMVAVFDTAYHQTLPPKAYLYGLSHEVSETYKIRRYGFHGTSHKYIAMQAANEIGKSIYELKIITCHLGNGSSIAAIKHGRCVDTSMGFTPLEGLVMGTRCGDIDPSIIQFLMQKKDMTIKEVMWYLNSECGVLGLSGKSSDFRDLWNFADRGDERCRTAIDVFCYRVKKYIGAYAAAIGGVDAIVFSGGIGENDLRVREAILEGLDYLGVRMDHTLNAEKGAQRFISTPESKVVAMVIRTNEELMIAKDTLDIVRLVG